jgi:hypothetical protein
MQFRVLVIFHHFRHLSSLANAHPLAITPLAPLVPHRLRPPPPLASSLTSLVSPLSLARSLHILLSFKPVYPSQDDPPFISCRQAPLSQHLRHLIVCMTQTRRFIKWPRATFTDLFLMYSYLPTPLFEHRYYNLPLLT